MKLCVGGIGSQVDEAQGGQVVKIHQLPGARDHIQGSHLAQLAGLVSHDLNQCAVAEAVRETKALTLKGRLEE